MGSAQSRQLPRSLGHHAVVALLCGLVSYGLIRALMSTLLIGNASDAAVDTIMRSQADAAQAHTGPPLTLLDVDDAEYARLERPLVFPRDKLALVLERVAAVGPRMIVIDVDLSWPDDAGRTRRLHEALARLRGPSRPPILLVRETLATGDGSKQYLPKSEFDDLAGRGSNLRFVVADLMASDDGVVRRTRPWQAVCDGTKTRVLAGVELAAWSVYRATSPAAALDNLEQTLNNSVKSCSSAETSTAVTISRGDQTRDWTDEPSTDRFVLRFGWQGSERLVPGADGSVAFAVVPAAPLLGPSVPSDALLRDRIVVIGVSAAAARDTHATPIGDMPGDMIVANLLFTGIGEGPPTQAGLLVGLVIVLVMSAITFGLWVVCRRILNLNVVLVREGLKLALTGFWGVAAWLFLARGAVLDYAFPQYVVITYLAYSEGFDLLF